MGKSSFVAKSWRAKEYWAEVQTVNMYMYKVYTYNLHQELLVRMISQVARYGTRLGNVPGEIPKYSEEHDTPTCHPYKSDKLPTDPQLVPYLPLSDWQQAEGCGSQMNK